MLLSISRALSYQELICPISFRGAEATSVRSRSLDVRGLVRVATKYVPLGRAGANKP